MGIVEVFTIVISSIGMLLACAWIAAPLFQFADYTSHPIALTVGSVLLVAGLLLLCKSHVDLGANFSKSLAVRENHQLITNGVYRHVRHPMYLSFLIFSAGQAFVVPNYVAGPSFGVASILLVALRAGPEERMMVEEFGEDYETYRERSNLLIPGVW